MFMLEKFKFPNTFLLHQSDNIIVLTFMTFFFNNTYLCNKQLIYVYKQLIYVYVPLSGHNY